MVSSGSWKTGRGFFISPHHTTGLFLYPLKTLEIQCFSDVFRGYKKRPVAWNGLTEFIKIDYWRNSDGPYPFLKFVRKCYEISVDETYIFRTLGLAIGPYEFRSVCSFVGTNFSLNWIIRFIDIEHGVSCSIKCSLVDRFLSHTSRRTVFPYMWFAKVNKKILELNLVPSVLFLYRRKDRGDETLDWGWIDCSFWTISGTITWRSTRKILKYLAFKNQTFSDIFKKYRKGTLA